MPFDIEKIKKLEKLLHKVPLPINKKNDLHHVHRIDWIKKNFDVKNSDHPKRSEIMKLIDEIREP